jgi:hypothetical protein
MTVEELGQIAGVILSLAVAYIPGIRERFDALDGPGKARVMAALLLGPLSACSVTAASIPSCLARWRALRNCSAFWLPHSWQIKRRSCCS